MARSLAVEVPALTERKSTLPPKTLEMTKKINLSKALADIRSTMKLQRMMFV